MDLSRVCYLVELLERSDHFLAARLEQPDGDFAVGGVEAFAAHDKDQGRFGHVAGAEHVAATEACEQASTGAKAFRIYDAATGSYTPGTEADQPPQGHDAKCGFACHTVVKNRDYVFTEYAAR